MESSAYQRAGSGGGGVGGRGGKIRKNTNRNTQATPYERPLTALRISNNSVKNNNGWLSRLLDPTSRVITTGARKFLSSVFSKRILPSAAPKQPASDGAFQSRNKHQGISSTVQPVAGENIEDVTCGNPKLDIVEVAELEQMLKQKRFTRSEIDRLTTLLRSRTVNGSIRDEEENPSLKIANDQVLKEHTYTPQRDNIGSLSRYTGFTPTTTSRHRVFDDNITSPLELAKAYMSSRTSKYSSPISYSEGLSPNYWTPNSTFPSKSPTESRQLGNGLVSLSSGGQATTSSDGRVRHSRMHQPTSLKGSEIRRVAYGELSPSAYELSLGQQRVSGFRNTSLKRRSCVLQDQYGSIGPIRRVRQKLNLLSSKGTDAPVLDSSSPISGSRDRTMALTDAPASSVDPAPSHLTEVAQQMAPPLDQLVSPPNEATTGQISTSTKGKSPLLSASETIASQVSENHERGESSGVKKDAQYDNTMDDSHDTLLYNAGYSKASKNEQKMASGFSAEMISDTVVPTNTPLPEATFRDVTNSPVSKKLAFRMSVLEDFVDMDEDDAEVIVSGSISATSKGDGVPLPIVSTDAAEVEKPSVVLPAGRSTMNGEMGSKIVEEAVISENSNILRGSVDDATSGLKSHAPYDSKLQMFRFGSGSVDVDRTSKPSESDGVNISPEAGHVFSKPEANKVAATPVLESSSIFSFGTAANNKAGLFNSSSGASSHSTILQSNFTSDTKQNNISSTNLLSFGSSNGLTSSPTGSSAIPSLNPGSHAENSTPHISTNPDSSSAASEIKTSSDLLPHAGSGNPFGVAVSATSNIGTPIFGFSTSATSTTLNSLPQSSAASGFGSELADVHKSNDGSEMALSASSSAPMTSLFGTTTPKVGASVSDSSSAAVVSSFAASSTSASATNPSTSSLFGASSTTGSGTVFAFGATSTTGAGLTTAATTNTDSPFGATSTSGPTTATTNNGFAFGASSTPAGVTGSSGISFGASSTSSPANSTSTATAGFSFGASPTSAPTGNVSSLDASSASFPTSSGSPFGASSIPGITSSGLPSGTSSTPATASTGFSFGASSNLAATSTGFPFGASSTPAATTTGFSFGASSNPATTSTVFSSGTSSTPATISSGISFGASSTPATASNGFPFGASSTPATTSNGFPFGASSTPATTSSGFSFGASSTPATTSTGFSFGASSTPASSGLPFGASSTPASSGFSLGSSSTSATTSTGFSFGGSSTPAAVTNGVGNPFVTSSTPASSAFPFGASSTPTSSTNSTFLFGASSTSTPVTTAAGFPSGSSSAPGGTTSSAFPFGSSSTTAPFSSGASSAPTSTTTNNGSPFGFNPFNASAASNTPAPQPLFGSSNPFGSTSLVNNNNNQASMEDSMAEDNVQPSTPAFPVFGQPAPNTSNFGFPSGSSNSFQFGSQQNLSNPSPFQASGSLGGFSAGGSFSLGTSGDKSTRRIIKPKKGRRK